MILSFLQVLFFHYCLLLLFPLKKNIQFIFPPLSHQLFQFWSSTPQTSNTVRVSHLVSCVYYLPPSFVMNDCRNNWIVFKNQSYRMPHKTQTHTVLVALLRVPSLFLLPNDTFLTAFSPSLPIQSFWTHPHFSFPSWHGNSRTPLLSPSPEIGLYPTYLDQIETSHPKILLLISTTVPSCRHGFSLSR